MPESAGSRGTIRHCDTQREGKSIWFPNSGKVLRERFVLLFYAVLHCPSFIPPPLCLTFLALLPFILLPGNANCCLFTGWLATRMDCVYISFKCGSTSMVSWLRVCMCACVCVWWAEGKGGVFWEREDGREWAWQQTWLQSTFSKQFYYLLADRDFQGTLRFRF